MYWYKSISFDKNICKSEQNKRLHKEAFRLLEKKLIAEFHFKEEDLKYKYGLKGKPYLEKSSLYFSISHCNNVIVCAISDNNIGIDIEDIKTINKFVVKKSLTDIEKIRLLSSNNNEEYFFRIWTLKESLIKAIGDGLSYGMKNIEFDISKNRLKYKENYLNKNNEALYDYNVKDKIYCNIKGFGFNQEKIRNDNKEYIISIAWEDSNGEY